MNASAGGSDHWLAQLSSRERSTLELLARGLSNEGIAEELVLNLKTVEGLIRSVFIKVGLGAASPLENRRVKAAVMYLAAVQQSGDSGVRLSRDLRALMATAPFDSLASVLEQRSPEVGEERWLLRATAAWFATIHEDFARAGRLARRAHDGAAGSEVGHCVTRGMVMMLDAVQGVAVIDQTCLDDVLEMMLRQVDTNGEIAHVCAHLEIPNWFTFADRFGDAATLIGRFIDHDRLKPQEQLWLLCCQVELDLRRGRWDQAESSLVAVLELSRLAGVATGYADALGARLQALRGDSSAARAHLTRSRAAGLDRGDRSTLWRADAAECLLTLGADHYRDAAALAGSLHLSRTRSGLRLPSVRWWDLDAIDALLRAGRADLAEALVHELTIDVECTASASGRAMLLAATGMLAGENGVDTLREAADRFGQLGAPFERARALLWSAEAQAESAPASARAAALAALAVFEPLRSVRWAAKGAAMLAKLPIE